MGLVEELDSHVAVQKALLSIRFPEGSEAAADAIRQSSEMFELGMRMGALVALDWVARRIDPARLPLGPADTLSAIVDAVSELGGPDEDADVA